MDALLHTQDTDAILQHIVLQGLADPKFLPDLGYSAFRLSPLTRNPYGRWGRGCSPPRPLETVISHWPRGGQGRREPRRGITNP